MAQADEIRRLIKNKFQAKQDRLGALPGQLGDGYNNCVVEDRENYVYCRIAGSVVEVFNNRVPPENDLLVMVGYDPMQPDLFQVLSTRSAVPGGTTGGAQTGYAPAIRYEWMAPGGGQDPLYVDKRVYMPRRIGATGSMVVQVYRDILWTGTTWQYLDVTNVDMTAYVPVTAGKAALVLITLSDTGAVIATAGSEFTLADANTAALVLAQLPEVPTGTRDVLGAVRVYAGQTAVQEARNNTDIIDLRGSGWGKDGDVVGPTSALDGHLAVFDGTSGKLLKDGGAIGAGGGGNAIDTPPDPPGAYDDEFTSALSGWTTLGTLDTCDAGVLASMLHLYNAANPTTTVNGIYKAAPSMPFTMTAKLTDARLNGNYQDYGIFVGEAAPGKLCTYGKTYITGAIDASRHTWTNRTTRVAYSDTPSWITATYYRMIVTSSTDIVCQWSINGYIWTTSHGSFSPGFTVGSVGLFICSHDSSLLCDAAFDWIRFS